jgi:multidrug resistance efflux pump
MTIKLNAPATHVEGLAVNSVKLVTAVAVFLILMTTVIGSVSQVRAVTVGANAGLGSGPHTVLPGTLFATRNTAVFVDFPATVQSIAVAPGEAVEAGQLLAVLENPELSLAARRAEARFARAAERLSSFKQPGDQDLAFQIQQEEHAAAEQTWMAAVKRLDGFDLESPQHAYQGARERSAQMKALLAQQLVTSAEVEQSLREEQAALQTLQSSLEHYSRLSQEVTAAQSRLKISQMRISQYEGSESANARREYDEARIDLELARRRLDNLNVKSPRPGTVLKIGVAAGDRIVSGAPVVNLSDLSNLHVEVPVAAKVARQITVGAPVEIRLPTDPPREVAAAVQSVLLVRDARSQSYLVQVRIPNPEPGVILAGLDCAVVFSHIDMGEPWLTSLF